MKTLESIFPKLNAGDVVLMQKGDRHGVMEKPELVIIVGMDIWDMACAVYYTKYKDFSIKIIDNKHQLKIYSFGEWMEFWQILGHWKSMPKFKNLIKSYRKSSKL